MQQPPVAKKNLKIGGKSTAVFVQWKQQKQEVDFL